MAGNEQGEDLKSAKDMYAARLAGSWRVGAQEDVEFEPVYQAPLDPLDTAIARALERDSRISLLELSRQLGTSRTTISERLARLVEQGIIKGFNARLDTNAWATPLRPLWASKPLNPRKRWRLLKP